MQLHRNIKLLAIHNFCTDFVLFAPVAILYFQQVTGSYALGMSIFSIAYGSAALLEIPTGILSDYLGRKKTLILGSFCNVCCLILYALGGAYWVLVLGSLFQGAARAFFSGNNDALLHDTLQETHQTHQYDEFLGKTASLFQFGLALAALFGGFIANWSFAWVMWLSVLPQVCAFLVSFLIVQTKTHTQASGNVYQHLGKSLQAFKNNYRLKLLTISSVIRFSLGESGYFFRSAFVTTLWPIWAIGIANVLSNIGAAISFYFSSKILKKYSYKRFLPFEIVFNRFVNLVALIFPTIISPALMTLSSLTFGIGRVAENTLFQKEFGDKERATMGSINSFAGNIGFAVVSFLIGLYADKVGPQVTLITIQVLLLSVLFVYKKLFYSHS